jgi:chorismate mutase
MPATPGTKMSSATLPRPSDRQADAPSPDLLALRAELDALDDALLDTLHRRAEVVERVGALGRKGPVALRPGREAAIIRRLLARHTGALPRAAIARIWRELLSATTLMQGPTLFSVCETVPGGDTAALAREHFGALARLHIHRTPAQALREVSSGLATAGLLPVPVEEGCPSGPPGRRVRRAPPPWWCPPHHPIPPATTAPCSGWNCPARSAAPR